VPWNSSPKSRKWQWSRFVSSGRATMPSESGADLRERYSFLMRRMAMLMVLERWGSRGGARGCRGMESSKVVAL
jgi:hypothetical protein